MMIKIVKKYLLTMIVLLVITACGDTTTSQPTAVPSTPDPYFATPSAASGGEPYQIRSFPEPEVTPTYLPADMELNPLQLKHPVLMIPDTGLPFVYPEGYPIVEGMKTMRVPEDWTKKE